jgi:pimeloyl-ACP methyl ester carboxylesterase
MNPLDHGSHQVTINGAKLAYHVHGEGPVVVALPGGPGMAHNYMRSPKLESQVKVVYVDPIGTGESARLDSPAEYGRARDVSDLEELRKHLGLDRMTLLGHSAGGFVVQQYAIAHPSNVARMVLFDTTPTNRAEFDASLKTEMDARSDRPWFAAGAGAFQTVFSRIITDAEAREIGTKIVPFYLYDYEATPELANVLNDTLRLNPVRMQQAPPVPFDFRTDLAKLDIPTLIIVGARDFICAPRLASLLHEAIPGSQLLVLERSGHMGHVEEPEVFASAVAAFVR